MQIILSHNAEKALRKLDKKRRDNIIEAIQGIPQGDIKPMEGKPEGRYRLRIGSYRVIFRYDKNGNMVIVVVLEISPRGDAYK